MDEEDVEGVPAGNAEMEIDITKESSDEMNPEEIKQKEVWTGEKQMEDGEELVYENSAYELFYKSNVEWPCLTIDFLLPERIGSTIQSSEEYKKWFPEHVNKLDQTKVNEIPIPEVDNVVIQRHVEDKYPYDVSLVTGCQATKPTDNKLYVMKWINLSKTLYDDQEENILDEDDAADAEPGLFYEGIPHMGAVNRVRAMHGSNIVATWSDKGIVSIYDLKEAYERVEKKASTRSNVISKKKYKSMIAKFKHPAEGYALDWSPFNLGMLASGGCDSLIHLYYPTDSDSFANFT